MADTTPSNIKAEILADLWMDYRDDKEFKEFMDYNDLGLPLAYAVANGIIELTDSVERFIDEAFTILLSALGIVEDEGFENLTDVLATAEDSQEGTAE